MIAISVTAATLATAAVGLAVILVFRLLRDCGCDMKRKARALWEDFQVAWLTICHIMFSNQSWSYVDFFESKVDADPSAVQFITVEDEQFVTLKHIEHKANQLSHWAKNELTLKQGECVALLMTNRPEILTFWLGMAKVGLSTALINSSIVGKPFEHSVKVSLEKSEKKVLVIDHLLSPKLDGEISNLEQSGVRVFIWNELEKLLCKMPSERPGQICRSNVSKNDPLIWIFTSGTTGLPKASKISSTKYFKSSIPGKICLDLSPSDRFYNCLPLYHSAGGVMALGACIQAGVPMVIRKCFSASAFTEDCLKYRCTVMQYIGELCRYLINTPPNSRDREVSLKAVIGNGMRPDVWRKFIAKYNVKRVVEFYASTEGNCALVNNTGEIGALGWLPSLLKLFMPVYVLRVDPEDNTKPIRDLSGYCTVAKPGEIGLLCALINTKSSIVTFDGYSDSQETEKKILRNVFRHGDAYFNSGDLVWTRGGYYYWSDRAGDTFRWKGENVSTTEVENALSECQEFTDVTVYGVEVPHCDGRVGMAAITVADGVFADDKLWKKYIDICARHLPSFARPVFLRLRSALATTATFKHKKTELVKEGFDPQNSEIVSSGDKLYFYSIPGQKIVEVTCSLYTEFLRGTIKI